MDLGTDFAGAGEMWRRCVRRELRLEPVGILAQHVDLEQIRPAVAIHVGHVDRHPRIARRADRLRGREPEVAASVVEPKEIGILEIVDDVEVGRAVAIQIREHGREPKFFGLTLQRVSVLVQETPVAGYPLTDKVAGAVVAVKEIGVGTLLQTDPAEILAVHHTVFPGVLVTHPKAAAWKPLHDVVEAALLGRHAVDGRIRLVIRDVEIEIAVAIDVGHGNRRTACG